MVCLCKPAEVVDALVQAYLDLIVVAVVLGRDLIGEFPPAELVDVAQCHLKRAGNSVEDVVHAFEDSTVLPCMLRSIGVEVFSGA
ncbi:MAG: hypothetical protein GX882_08900 [Methanomicrobiales archaeon]|nr:hypothetical protein [Methanomicrobiales archaeon]